MFTNKLFLLFGVAHCVTALEPTKVQVKLVGAGANWTLADVPKTTRANTPDFSFRLTSSGSPAAVANPTFTAKGSLGFPRHPLGILNFHANGSACGTQTIEIMDGILGEAVAHFPPCPWAATPLEVPIQVHVWTVIPAIPPLFSTGFEVQVALAGATGLPTIKIDLVASAKSGATKGQDLCQTDQMDPAVLKYPPSDEFIIPTVQVSLDDPPLTRWDHVVKPRAQGISKLINTFVHNAPINATVLKILLDLAGSMEMKRMPHDYVEEIRGIGKSTGLDFSHIWIMNMMYEITGFCTSLVAQDANGKVWHARNLDFGLFDGTDPLTHTWTLTEALKAILVNVEFTRGGKVLYHSTTYAGFVGVLSGSRDQGFGVTVNTRYDSNLDAGLIRWLTGKAGKTQFLTFQTRMVMENFTTYADAFRSLTTYKPIGPAYIIVSGTNSGEGAVIAKQYNKTAEKAGIPWDPNADVWNLTEVLSKGSFYVLETNYDRRSAPPGFDDRRYPAENCMDSLGASGVTAESLWGVMSSNPSRNALTTFTTIISPGSSYFRAYKQKCVPGPRCSPF